MWEKALSNELHGEGGRGQQVPYSQGCTALLAKLSHACELTRAGRSQGNCDLQDGPCQGPCLKKEHTPAVATEGNATADLAALKCAWGVFPFTVFLVT